MEKTIELTTSGDDALTQSLPLARADGTLQNVATLQAAAAALLADDKKGFSLRYTDSDGDEVTIAHDADVKELANYMADEQLEKLTVQVLVQGPAAGRRAATAVQTQLRGLVTAMSKLTTAKPRKATPANAMNLLVASLQTMDVADDSEELAAVKKELLIVLQDEEFKRAVDELTASEAFKELADVMAAAIYKEDAEAIEEAATAHFNELLVFAQRVVARCPTLKMAMVHVAKSCVSGLVRFNDEKLAEDGSDSSSSSSSSYSDDQETVDVEAVVEEVSVHLGVMCNGCQKAPLIGVRYKSLEVLDFDLCEECEATGKWVSHEPFIKITDPSRAPKHTRRPEIVHPFVVCDGCEMSPIVGPRFKSKTAEDFDLCEACEASGRWAESHGPFTKIQEPGMMHALKFTCRRGGKFGHHGKFGRHHGKFGHGHHEHHGRFGRHGHHHGPPGFPFQGTPPHHRGFFDFTTSPPRRDGPPGHGPPPHHEGSSGFPGHGPSPHREGPCEFRGPQPHYEGPPSFPGHGPPLHHEHGHPGFHGHHGHRPPPPTPDFDGEWRHHGPPRFPDPFGPPPFGFPGPHGPPPCPPKFPPGCDPRGWGGFRGRHGRHGRHMRFPSGGEGQQEGECRRPRGRGRWGNNASDHEARFLEDVTIEDGTVVEAGKPLRKMWKLVNNGERSWPDGCYMTTQSGNPMLPEDNESSRIDLPALSPGEEFIAGVDLVAPKEPGRYSSFWRVCDPADVSFGHRFWIDIVVVCDGTPEVASPEAVTAESTENIEKEDAAGASDDDIEMIEAAEAHEVENYEPVSIEGEDKVNYEEALSLLASMGFADTDKNILALELANGNVDGAVNTLLSE